MCQEREGDATDLKLVTLHNELNNLPYPPSQWEAGSSPSSVLPIHTFRTLEGLSTALSAGGVDLTRPVLFKNLTATAAFTIAQMLGSDLRDLEVDYFADARVKNTVPDQKGKLGDVVEAILEGGPQKVRGERKG